MTRPQPGRDLRHQTATNHREANTSMNRIRDQDGRPTLYMGMSQWSEAGRPPRRCQWIEGQPTADDSCFQCRRKVKPGSPYCAPHDRRAYQLASPRKIA